MSKLRLRQSETALSFSSDCPTAGLPEPAQLPPAASRETELAPPRHRPTSAPARWGSGGPRCLDVMVVSRLPPATLTLKQFVRRQQVLLLYRRILQAIRQVPNDSDRKYLKDWAREEFKRNKSATEEDTIRMMITQGNMQLKELEKTLALARS
ncbi:LYR motif-containing protein 2 isoform 2-T2 [Megaptera novaeangliae]